ncbi:hypothetical protein [Pseudogemmobacter blasticus]|uniref:Uncharacterized protein n=1 Tax=Fuscovulum blasticum DSM 2131 TaxID=1188250 RepID=A0A2T4J994_FUSBL|nr:hypothetical protein [Fuscovulum blasticum]PTE14462.1 hypothetical protein C5F44_08760 [Fuscovulum blasticum DSM 2131]
MTTWLEFLWANPESDFESVMELHVPMSVQIEVMRRAEELGVTRVDVMLSALATSGIVTELAL